jgi:ornithine cyclodeaminase/alanine dehydrogenase-like protein (mu-crystallin family)
MIMYLGEEKVSDFLRWDLLIAAMETALASFSLGRVLQPVRNMLTIEEGKRYLGIMPAVAEDAMGVKLVSFYPGMLVPECRRILPWSCCSARTPANRWQSWTDG